MSSSPVRNLAPANTTSCCRRCRCQGTRHRAPHPSAGGRLQPQRSQRDHSRPDAAQRPGAGHTHTRPERGADSAAGGAAGRQDAAPGGDTAPAPAHLPYGALRVLQVSGASWLRGLWCGNASVLPLLLPCMCAAWPHALHHEVRAPLLLPHRFLSEVCASCLFCTACAMVNCLTRSACPPQVPERGQQLPGLRAPLRAEHGPPARPPGPGPPGAGGHGLQVGGGADGVMVWCMWG
jgi:hypothetical protein